MRAKRKTLPANRAALMWGINPQTGQPSRVTAARKPG